MHATKGDTTVTNAIGTFSSSALIGHTGFVGSNIAAQSAFSHYYNSKNIDSIADGIFDLLVCSGISAVKWWANKNPEADWAGIERLLKPLATVKAKRFVLISTIDVYPTPNGVDEDTDVHSLTNHAYGVHRLRVEDYIRNQFSNVHVVRLPGLFGTGLKKNVIFDLLNHNCLDSINTESAFQYYNLENIWNDIKLTIKHNIPLVNIAAEPIKTRAIIDSCFPGVSVGKAPSPTAFYDMQTKYANLWMTANNGRYQYQKEQVLSELKKFVASSQKEKNT